MLSLNKLLRCVFPMRSLYTTLGARRKVIVTVVIWVVSSIPTLAVYFLDRGYQFDTSINSCFETAWAETTPTWKKLSIWTYDMFTGVPIIVTMLCNLGLLIVVLINRRSALRGAIILILSLTFFLIISWTPAIIVCSTVLRQNFVFNRVAHYFVGFDLTFSPLVYLRLNAGFREYVMEKLCLTARTDHVTSGPHGGSPFPNTRARRNLHRANAVTSVAV